MQHCDFYQSNHPSFESRERNPSNQQKAIASGTVVWCTHKHSPCTEELARSVIGGGAGLLTCGGDFDKCTIALEKFMDVVRD